MKVFEMNKIKDILYDKNDILVALLILCIATFVIFTRIEHIMAYPERMLSAQSPENGSVAISFPTEPDDNLSAPDDYEEPPNGDEGDEETPEYTPEDPSDEAAPQAHSLYIASGESMNTIARNLVSLGLFESEQDFLDTLTAHNAATRVQVGNFIIPADATKDDVIRIITGVAQ